MKKNEKIVVTIDYNLHNYLHNMASKAVQILHAQANQEKTNAIVFFIYTSHDFTTSELTLSKVKDYARSFTHPQLTFQEANW